MTIQRMTVPVEWKSLSDIPDGELPAEWVELKAKDDGNTLVGYASTFDNVDLGGDAVQPGAFTKTLDNIKSNGIPLLADHMMATAYVLGTVADGKEDAKGLLILAPMSKAPSAQDTATKLREGHLSKLSIGYETMAESFEDRNGQRVRLLHEVKLHEVSVVVFPMNPEATVQGVKTLMAAAVEAGQTAEQIDRAATDAGFLLDLKDVTPRAHDDGDYPDTLAVWKSVMHVEHAVGVPSAVDGQAVDSKSQAGHSGGATPAPGDEPGQGSDEEPKGSDYDRYRSEALIHGRPTGDADPATRANLAEALKWTEQDPNLAPLLTGDAAD